MSFILYGRLRKGKPMETENLGKSIRENVLERWKYVITERWPWLFNSRN